MNKRAMAIVALALCACMLAPCAQAQADPTLVEAGRFSAYAEFAETAALVIDEDAQTGLEGVFDIQGEALVPAAFGAIEQADEEANFFIVQNESGVNAIGLIDRTAPGHAHAYGDIEILSDCWAVGIKLEVAQGEEYDYMSLFGQDNYNVATCDFYDLSAGELRGTLTREEYNYAVVVGEYLLVEGSRRSAQLLRCADDPGLYRHSGGQPLFALRPALRAELSTSPRVRRSLRAT